MCDSKPWIDVHFTNNLSGKISLWRKFQRSGCPVGYERHRTFSNQLSAKITSAGRKYEDSITCNEDSKKFYPYVRSALFSKVGKPLLRRSDGTLCENHVEVSEILANSFCKSFTAEPTDLPVTFDTTRSNVPPLTFTLLPRKSDITLIN